MNSYLFRFSLLFAFIAIGACSAGGCARDSVIVGISGAEAGASSTGGTAAVNPGNVAKCLTKGESCDASEECCSGSCNPQTGSCGGSLAECLGVGEKCDDALDCCSLSCVAGDCAASCVADEGVCESGESCCSGLCEAGACTPLSKECLTSGNPCGESAECCSGLCDGDHCVLLSSFCVQPGDVCKAATECCTGNCEIDIGRPLGTCGAPPKGATNCSDGVAGTLCGDCNDCCSRICAPYGATGVSICQPASGCKLTGELCRSDLDCCGGDPESGLPGAGNVVCSREEGAEFGICRNAKSCSPQGNACHFKDYTCSVSSAANKCCDGSEAKGECLLDDFGMPRCDGLGTACRGASETCASSSDCCEGHTCLPDESGRLLCIGTGGACGTDGGTCATTSDCCSGFVCQVGVGALAGRCVTKTTSCAEFGQKCSSVEECCPGIACSSGLCVELSP